MSAIEQKQLENMREQSMEYSNRCTKLTRENDRLIQIILDIDQNIRIVTQFIVVEHIGLEAL